MVMMGLAASALMAAVGGVLAPQPPPGEWPSAGRDPGLTRFSPLKLITTENVTGLRPVWSFSTGLLRAHEGNPLVVGSVMYVHGPFPNAVYALDLAKPGGPILWSFAVPPAVARLSLPTGCCEVGSRGLGYHPSGKLYVPLLHGDLVALDARSGQELWRAKVTDYRLGATLPAAPAVVKDVVIVGTGGADYGVRGYLSGYHALTGRLLWRGYHTGPDAEVLLEGEANGWYPSHKGRDLGVTTWPADEWKRGGATASGWISYDPELNLIFYGTDRPASGNPASRAGENKWSAAIFARSPETGNVKWAYQLTPHDEWGYDGSNENTLVDLRIGGAIVKALVHFDRNGFAYTLERATGRLVIAERYAPANWASRIDGPTAAPVREQRFAVGPTKTAGVCPAAPGAKGLQPTAFSPITSLFYVPVMNLCMDIQAAVVSYTSGRPYAGATVKLVPGPGPQRGRFIAWDAATATVAWQAQETHPVTGGALATAGGLVFYGTMDGWLKALDHRSGLELWRFKTPSGIVGSPITFSGPDGKQYLAVLSGLGGWVASSGAAQVAPPSQVGNTGGVLMVFGLE
jgi:PQQ-dependent dehydrogenase (methanol/ethanol family)